MNHAEFAQTLAETMPQFPQTGAGPYLTHPEHKNIKFCVYREHPDITGMAVKVMEDCCSGHSNDAHYTKGHEEEALKFLEQWALTIHERVRH